MLCLCCASSRSCQVLEEVKSEHHYNGPFLWLRRCHSSLLRMRVGMFLWNDCVRCSRSRWMVIINERLEEIPKGPNVDSGFWCKALFYDFALISGKTGLDGGWERERERERDAADGSLDSHSTPIFRKKSDKGPERVRGYVFAVSVGRCDVVFFLLVGFLLFSLAGRSLRPACPLFHAHRFAVPAILYVRFSGDGRVNEIEVGWFVSWTFAIMGFYLVKLLFDNGQRIERCRIRAGIGGGALIIQ